MKKLAMASFDFLLLRCGLERGPGRLMSVGQHWPRFLEAAGSKVHRYFLQRRDREELEEAFRGFGPTSATMAGTWKFFPLRSACPGRLGTSQTPYHVKVFLSRDPLCIVRAKPESLVQPFGPRMVHLAQEGDTTVPELAGTIAPASINLRL
jgi:hypothetical protein